MIGGFVIFTIFGGVVGFLVGEHVTHRRTERWFATRRMP